MDKLIFFLFFAMLFLGLFVTYLMEHRRKWKAILSRFRVSGRKNGIKSPGNRVFSPGNSKILGNVGD